MRRAPALLACVVICGLAATARAQSPESVEPARPWDRAPLDENPASVEPVVVSVGLQVPPGTDPEGIAEHIAVTRGQPLSLRAVRRSIERLYATGRFSDVVARRVNVEGGLRIIFELTLKQRIGSLDVVGAKILRETEILAATRLEEGDEFYPELLQLASERVQALYTRRGYRQSKVSIDLLAGERGTEVLLIVDEGPPTVIEGVTVGGNPGLPIAQLVDALEATPGGVLDLEQLEDGIERLKTLYREQGYYRARVGEPEVVDGARGGVLVAVPANAGPKYAFHFHGNRNFPDKLLLGILSYDGTETLDEGVLSRLSRRVASFYRYRGFHDVRVTPREVRTPTQSQAVIAFDIEEGRPLWVKRIVFEGNRALSNEVLRRILADQIRTLEPVPRTDVPDANDPLRTQGRTEGGAGAPSPDPGPLRVFVPDAYAEAAKAMRDAYLEQGHLSAEVAVPEVNIDVAARTADVTFHINEGPQTVVKEIKYYGLPEDFDPSKALALKEGAPFRYSGLGETVRALTRLLGRDGYLFGQVDAKDSYLSDDKRDAFVFLRIDAGPHVKIGEVIVRGLNRSSEEMVRANVTVRKGDFLDPEALFESQRNLALLGIFKSVGVRLIDPEQVEAVKDVVVDVKERSRVAGEVGIGFSLVDGPRVVGDLSYPNLWGSATSLTARAKLNYVGASALVVSDSRIDPEELTGLNGLDGRVNVAITQPRIYALLPVRVGVRGDLIAERVHRPTFNFSRLAGVMGADWAAKRWLTVALQYEAEQYQVRITDRLKQITSLGNPTLERYRFTEGAFSLHSLRPSVTFDFRDDFAHPSRGVLLNGSAELSQDLTSALGLLGIVSSNEFPIYSLKVSGSATVYVPLAPRFVLALSARGGKFFHIPPGTRSIAPKRFFMGGATSMRGFREDGLLAEDRRSSLKADRSACLILATPYGCSSEVATISAGQEVPSEGGEIFTLYKTELRFPVYGAFDLGVFFEAGNLWLDQSQFDGAKLRYVAGTGLRYGTPIGPIALDLGVNLIPDLEVNEPRANAHFSIGLF